MTDGLAKPDIDAAIAATWPARWAKANDPTRRNRSKARNNLRKAYAHKVEHDRFVASNPSAACANCAHKWQPPHTIVLACQLDSDFHGYQTVSPIHVCTRWGASS